MPGLMKLPELQQVLQLLLREQVPIRQLGKILETLGDHAARIKDPLLLAEELRAALGDALAAASRLVAALKHQKKEKKALTQVWSSLKALNLGPGGQT